MSFIPLASPLPTSATKAGDVVDATNTSTTPLIAGGVFTGAWVDMLSYSQIAITIFTDQPGASNALQVQFSPDSTPHIDHIHTYAVTANQTKHVEIPAHSQYYRIVYTNGATPQGVFRLHTVLRPVSASGSIIKAVDNATTEDSCLLTKSVITGQVTGGSDYVNAKMTADGGLVINQNIQIDPANSSTTNLAVGASFTGATSPNITATLMQVVLNTDQNCTVYIDQSMDGAGWDTVDEYKFYAATGNFAMNTNAVGAYYRIRVTNTGLATTTYFRLQTIVVPIMGTLPRSLSPEGYLQVSTQLTRDHFGFSPYYTPHGEQVSVPIYRLIGSTFSNNQMDTDSWTASVGTGGTVAVANGLLSMATGTSANNATSFVSTRVARYTVGQPNTYRTIVQLPDTGTLNNIRRGGAYTATDGVFFELDGTTFNLVTRLNSVDTKVANGTFNGHLGNYIVPDTLSHSWEIVYQSNVVYFLYDNEIIHTSTFHTTPWTATKDLPIRHENFNINGSTTNVVMSVHGAVISKTGIPQTQPVGRNVSGATTMTLKVGAGNLHGITINNNAGTSVTLYDSLTGSGPIIATITPNQLTTLDFKGILFSAGLTIVTVGSACNCTVMYE